MLTFYWLLERVAKRYGNERADRLAKAAARRAHLAAARTDEQREEQALEALAESIVLAITRR